MKFSILTYNLLFNKASRELGEMLTKYKPDLLFLQELTTDEKSLRIIQRFGYRLADFSNSFIKSGKIYGVATFYKPTAFSLRDSKSFSLPSSIYQIITYILRKSKNPRTVLKNKFEFKNNGVLLTTYNIHLTPVATNMLRIKQITNTFKDFHFSKKNPVIVAGDFNYPYGRKKLEAILQQFNLKEATNNVFFTHERKMLGKFALRLKLDYVFFRNITLLKNEKLAYTHSDHFPIYSSFELSK